MNEISKLTQRILDEAKSQAAAADEAAKRECGGITAAYEAEADKEAAAVLAAAQAQADAILRRATSQAGIEGRNMKLTARRESIDEAFALAEQKLRSYPADKLTEFLIRLAMESQTADAQLIWGRGDRALARAVVDGVNARSAAKGVKLTLSEETGSFDGGFILREGSIETNCTFPVLIHAVAEELEARVAAALLD